MMTANEIHVFERAGLGTAPFRYVGFSEDRGPHISERNGVTLTVGSPGQLKSADGREFIVGCECVKKTGDRGLINKIKQVVNKKRTAARHIREAARIEALKVTLADEAVRAILQQQPAPGNSPSANALEWVSWMMKNAGNAGMIRVARFVDKVIK